MHFTVVSFDVIASLGFTKLHTRKERDTIPTHDFSEKGYEEKLILFFKLFLLCLKCENNGIFWVKCTTIFLSGAEL